MGNDIGSSSTSVTEIIRRYGLLRDDRLKRRIHEELVASGNPEGANRYSQPAHEIFVAILYKVRAGDSTL